MNTTTNGTLVLTSAAPATNGTANLTNKQRRHLWHLAHPDVPDKAQQPALAVPEPPTQFDKENLPPPPVKLAVPPASNGTAAKHHKPDNLGVWTLRNIARSWGINPDQFTDYNELFTKVIEVSGEDPYGFIRTRALKEEQEQRYFQKSAHQAKSNGVTATAAPTHDAQTWVEVIVTDIKATCVEVTPQPMQKTTAKQLLRQAAVDSSNDERPRRNERRHGAASHAGQSRPRTWTPKPMPNPKQERVSDSGFDKYGKLMAMLEKGLTPSRKLRSCVSDKEWWRLQAQYLKPKSKPVPVPEPQSVAPVPQPVPVLATSMETTAVLEVPVVTEPIATEEQILVAAPMIKKTAPRKPPKPRAEKTTRVQKRGARKVVARKPRVNEAATKKTTGRKPAAKKIAARKVNKASK